ncbi:MAG: ABC transporter permease [Ruminiclostridium sp.]|nr:ABC transporter permease [Ruminiclostridium sp.]
MIKYIIKRLISAILSLFIIMTMLFVLIRLLPNPVEQVVGGNAQALEDMRKAWGYDEPILVQYGIFLKNVFTKFDWGFCTTTGTFLQPVTEYISSKLPATLYINIFSVVISIPLGILFGMLAAIFKNKWQDKVLNVFIVMFISVPSFIYAILMQYIIGYRLGWCPLVMNSGTDYFSLEMIHSAIMPILALSFGTIAGDMRLVRAELSEAMTADYMLLARAKGLSRGQAIFRHALRNSMIPVLPTILANIIFVIGGSLIIEQIFSVPGVGQLYLNSINLRDYSLFMAISMFYTSIGLVAGIILDLSYGFIDPRVRMGGGKNDE